MPCNLNVLQKANRQIRLKENNFKLFHETSLEGAEAILNSQIMKKGKKGLAGGGIYFGDTAEDAHRKTENSGVMLTADVSLGNIQKISTKGEPNLTECKLLKRGFDSVMIPRRKGDEFVVYNSDQVKNIQISGNQGSLKDIYYKKYIPKKIPYMTSKQSKYINMLPEKLLKKL